MKVAAKEKNEESRGQLVNSAFVGWQMVSALGGKKVPSFQKYAKNLGVLPQDEKSSMLTKEQVNLDRLKSRTNVAKALAAFSKGVMKA